MIKKRSRTLWDEARKPQAPFIAKVRAVLYEVQPVRFSTLELKPWFSTVQTYIRITVLKVPIFIKFLLLIIRRTTSKQWLAFLLLFMYWKLVKFIHSTLEAGPIFIMMTAMLLIFTVGLGDRDPADPDYWSAYSVFNRGFKSIYGSMDVQDLVQQHVGGGWNVGLNAHHNNMEVNPQENRRRQEEEQDHQVAPMHPVPQINQARKSGKKLRRRNLEKRKEVQRQRQTAAALGFGGFDETEAMNRLIEEQAAALGDMEENDDGDLAAILEALDD